MKTPLRYPGGKSRAVKKILPHIKNLGGGELCSPFLGGGSIELACAEEGMIVHGYDLFKPVVWFWQALLQDPVRLALAVEKYRVPVLDYTDARTFGEWWGKDCSGKSGECLVKDKKKESYCNNHKLLASVYDGEMLGVQKKDFHLMRELVNRSEPKENNTKELFEYAARYYIVNRTSFSGATTSGGWSWKASWARLTDSSLQNLREFAVENFTVKRADFKESIQAHPDAVLYLDPPYALNQGERPEGEDRETLYGREGDHHSGFDHEGMASMLKKRSGWVLSYNDCDYVRSLYKGYRIVKEEWAYGMKNVKKEKMGESSEIIIIGDK
jgi:DNA adenine methylase